MPESASLTLAMTAEKVDRLRALASRLAISEEALAIEAIEAYLELQDWQAHEINSAIDEADRDSLRVPHETVARWMRSWGTEEEQPRPW